MAARQQADARLICFLWALIAWGTFFILGIVFTALGPDLTYDHRINDYNTEVQKYSAALQGSSFNSLKVTVSIQLSAKNAMDNNTAAVWQTGFTYNMSGSTTTPAQDGIPSDPKALQYVGYKYTTEDAGYTNGVQFFPSVRNSWMFVNSTYGFFNKSVPNFVGYNVTEQNVTLLNGSWQIQNVSEPIYDGNTTVRELRVVNSSYYEYRRDPQAFYTLNSVWYQSSPYLAPRYRITIKTVAPNGVVSNIVFDPIVQNIGSELYDYSPTEPDDWAWMSRICARIRETAPGSGSYVLDTNDLKYGDKIDNGGCECQMQANAYNYFATKPEDRATYSYPINPLIYKSERQPFTAGISTDVNVNLDSVSRVRVAVRFANDPLAFFNQKMRGNAISFGSNWYKRYNAGVGFLSFSMCVLGIVFAIIMVRVCNCTCNNACKDMCAGCPLAVRALFPGLSGHSANQDVTSVTPVQEQKEAAVKIATSAPAPSAAQLYGSPSQPASGAAAAMGHSADPAAAYSVPQQQQPPPPMQMQQPMQPIYSYGAPPQQQQQQQQQSSLMAQYPMQQQPPQSPMMAQPVMMGGGGGGYQPMMMNQNQQQPQMAMAVPQYGGGMQQQQQQQPQYGMHPQYAMGGVTGGGGQLPQYGGGAAIQMSPMPVYGGQQQQPMMAMAVPMGGGGAPMMAQPVPQYGMQQQAPPAYGNEPPPAYGK